MKKNTKNKAEKQKKLNLMSYLSSHKLGISMYIFVYLVASACSILMTIVAANAIEVISDSVANYSLGIRYCLYCLALMAVQRGCWYASGWIYSKTAAKIMAELNLDLAKQSFKLNSKTFNDHETGTFVQRIVNDPERIVECLADMVDVVTDIITNVIMLVYIATLNFWVTLVFLGAMGIGVLLELYRVRFRRKNKRNLRIKNDKIHSLTTEIVRSEKDIKSLGLEEKLSQVSRKNYEDYRNARTKYEIADMTFYSARNFISEIVGLLVCILGITLMDKGTLTLGAFMVIYSNRGSLSRLIWNFGAISNWIVDIKVSHERMFALFDEDEFVTEKFGKISRENVVGNIEFQDVSYTFKEYEYKTPQEQEDAEKKRKKRKKSKKKGSKTLVSENKIFDNLSFKVEPNTTVAFVGKSGSGKSTILNLMSKMYVADAGKVLIDGVDINDFDKETLRRTISLVNQFPYIFDMTIKENLLLAKADATDEEILDSIKKASLDEFVSSLPKGIETKVGESGIKLSGGQKQRLAIARAMLRKSNIIIFDESTSSLDNFAQEEVKKSIDMMKGKSTIVIVAHRLSTIKNVDKIFFLSEGKIVDQGTFEELFDRNEQFRLMFLAENI